MPEIPNVVDEQLIESQWGNAIRDRTVQRYADAAERDSLHPSPLGGDLAYLEAAEVALVYNGAAWVPVTGSPIRARTAGAFVDLTHTGPTVVAFNIVIPDGWNTYDVELLAVGRVTAQSPAGGDGGVRVVTWQARYNGVNVGGNNAEALIIPTAATNTKTKIQTVAATAVAQTVTGTVPIAITGTLDSTGENNEWRAIFPEARATAWWTS